MQTGYGNSCRRLDPCEHPVLADALGDTPETVHSIHLLRRGDCKAYVTGEPFRFGAAIVQAKVEPTEPVGFGSDPHLLWQLLKAVEGWECILVESGCARTLGAIIQQEIGVSIRYFDDVCHVLTHAVSVFQNESVRLLTLADLALLEASPLEFRASLWDSTHTLLLEGSVACAVVSGEIVSTALTTAYNDKFIDIGVYTHKDYRGRGLATAAASAVAKRVQEAGRIPVWSAGEHNIDSLRVAHKLGFTEVSRRTYVILERLQ